MKADIQKLERIANVLRRNVVQMIGVGHRGHYGGALSSAEIMAALYFYKMRHRPVDPKWEDRDRFVLSKGHSCPILYAALAESGYFDKKHLNTLKDLGSILQGHPDVLKTPGIEANTGSLGQGLSIGLGMALGLRLDKKDSKVYVILGDGEMGEGQIWEAGIVAAHYKLNNLVAFLDHNKIQAMGFTKDRINVGSLAEKWKAFGWHTVEIDGNNMEEVVKVLDDADRVADKPVMVIAHTLKGKGISFTENTPAFHNNLMTQEQFEQALFELNQKIGD
ncbi:MAG: transketolase [Bacteroidetes bacterium GWF2_42_66]|nr:MAG: transketolase [Bacteroidetes bacterium GWA2_42_15]OFX97121.1 MAG: transketolase [Bacteroidetes bacterium GWE2_42_39]OFY46192.1 MAG: transketolase [Bacteroidetes bacterium GWF2_42_66]HBL78042.1 transketolase [Prolixibacteraceae bacterium]HCU61326.1 transketolase [Prolixibacteraceae bacterium]